MKKNIVFAMFLISLFSMITPTLAQIISLGVMPSENYVYLSSSSPEVYIPFRFFNPDGDTNAIYSLSFEEDIQEFIECREGYWCGETISVPKGTERLENYVSLNVLFKQRSEEYQYFESGMYVRGRPAESDITGTISIEPRIFVKIFLRQDGTAIITDDSQPIEPKVSSVINIGSSSPVPAPDNKKDEETLENNNTEETVVLPPDQLKTTTTINTEIKGNKDSEKQEMQFPVLEAVVALIIISIFSVFGYRKFKNYKKDRSKFLVSIIIISMLMLPITAHAYSVDITVNVTNPAVCGDSICEANKGETASNCCIDCCEATGRTLTDIGTGFGSLVAEMGSPLTFFLTLLGIGSMVVMLLVSIGRRVSAKT